MRREVEDFNARVIAARYRLPEGPPLVTMPRDVDETVAAWRERRTARLPSSAARRARPQRPRPARRAPAAQAVVAPVLDWSQAVRSVIPTPYTPLLPFRP